MAAAAVPPVPLDYIRVFDLPTESSLPEELRGRILFSKANFLHANPNDTGSGTKARSANTSQKCSVADETDGVKGRGKGSGSGFNFSKALKAGLEGAGSAVTSRGDGKFTDGRDFAVSDAPGGRAKFVHLTQDALTPGNAERTLQQLDDLQKMAGRPQARPGGPDGRDPKSRAGAAPAQPRSTQQQHAAVFAAVSKSLYDINDDDNSGPGSRGVATAANTTAAAALSTAGEDRPGLRKPEYSLQELSGDGPTGHSRLEVAVQLPDVASPGDVDVWLATDGKLHLSVPGKYQLQLELPYPVHDDTSHAKWSKAKRRLTLTLSRASRR